MLGAVMKQPADQIDYVIDYARWITDDDEILTVEAHVSPDEPEDGGIEVISHSIDSPKVKVWLKGGVNGTTYKVTVIVATRDGRIKEEDFKVRVRDC